jgi:hypothetical protein
MSLYTLIKITRTRYLLGKKQVPRDPKPFIAVLQLVSTITAFDCHDLSSSLHRIVGRSPGESFKGFSVGIKWAQPL